MTAGALPTCLLVDDEAHSLAAMRMALEDDFDCLTAEDACAARRLMEENEVQVIFCDQRMPGMTGVEFLAELRARWPETVRIIITGYTETGDMIAAINAAGIYQFVTKPWHPDQLLMAARNAAQLYAMAREQERLSLEMRYLRGSAETRLEKRRKAIREGLGFDSILRAPNSPLNAVLATARHYAAFDVPVLIAGEPGTGKAALARAMHYGSLRADQPFLELDCAGMPDALIESDLFGARRGALPGVPTNRIGLAQKADRGTLFLNGIDSLGPSLQVAVLRLARDGMFTPLGAAEATSTGARLIAGAHGDLKARVADGRFRGDLYYALAVAEIDLPPLRARAGDIAVLAQDMLARAARRHGKPVEGFADAALEFLENHDWPGNQRELENEVTRMLIFAKGKLIGADLVSRHILQAAPGEDPADRRAASVLTGNGPLKDRLDLIEMRILRETLTRLKWNKSRAAAELGLSRVGLRAKLDRYGIAPPRHAAGSED